MDNQEIAEGAVYVPALWMREGGEITVKYMTLAFDDSTLKLVVEVPGLARQIFAFTHQLMAMAQLPLDELVKMRIQEILNNAYSRADGMQPPLITKVCLVECEMIPVLKPKSREVL